MLQISGENVSRSMDFYCYWHTHSLSFFCVLPSPLIRATSVLILCFGLPALLLLLLLLHQVNQSHLQVVLLALHFRQVQAGLGQFALYVWVGGG